MTVKQDKPIVIWREQVDERVWFEVTEEHHVPGSPIILWCKGIHPKRPDTFCYAARRYEPFEWMLALREFGGPPAAHKAELLHSVRYILCDLDAPELHQQLEVTLRAIAERMCPGTLLWRDEGFAFLRRHYELLHDIEHRLWADLKIPVEDYATWPMFCLPKRLSPEEIALFKRIADEAENWFTWNAKAGTYQFLPIRAWRKLDGEWRQRYRGPEYFNLSKPAS